MLGRVCVTLDKHSLHVGDREIYNNGSHNFLLFSPLKPPTSCFRSIPTFRGISVSVFVYMSTVDVWFGASMRKETP